MKSRGAGGATMAVAMMMMMMMMMIVLVEGIPRIETMMIEDPVSHGHGLATYKRPTLTLNVPSKDRPPSMGLQPCKHAATGFASTEFTPLAICRGGDGGVEHVHLKPHIHTDDKSGRKGTNPLVVLQRTFSMRPEYEFTQKDEDTFMNTTRLMRHVVHGLLVHSFVQSLVVVNNVWEQGIVAIPQFGDCIDELWYAYFINAASVSYEAIVHTQGADIHNLMQAVQQECQLWKKYRESGWVVG